MEGCTADLRDHSRGCTRDVIGSSWAVAQSYAASPKEVLRFQAARNWPINSLCNKSDYLGSTSRRILSNFFTATT